VFSRALLKMRNRIEVTEFGKNINLARIELDLTQTQLAEKMNAKQKSISRYETGASLPSIKTLVKIAKVLKKGAGYFWRTKAKKPSNTKREMRSLSLTLAKKYLT